jgi:primary-amine oxidase
MHFSALALTALLGIGSSSTIPFLGYDRRVARDYFDKRTDNATAYSCLTEAATTTVAPKTNPWAPLTPDENLAVWTMLHSPTSGLNLTDPTKAVLTDNYVYVTLELVLERKRM